MILIETARDDDDDNDDPDRNFRILETNSAPGI
jgi:hypothetical protein